MDSIDTFNKLNKSEFLSTFGNVFEKTEWIAERVFNYCLLYTSPSPRDLSTSRMPSSA